MSAVVDELGLVKENKFLTLYMPAYGAFVFRVKSRVNKGYERLHYGALPIVAGETLPLLDGGSTSVPADGVMPARSYTPTGRSFSMIGAFDEGDMWYTVEDMRDRLFHVIHKITPAFLRTDVQIPKGVDQGRFQRDRIITGVGKDFGFKRGQLEVVHIPRVHYGFRWANDTNVDVRTSISFIYAEYVIEMVKDADAVFNVLNCRIPSHWVTLPINVQDPTISTALESCYGITGFPIYAPTERERAMKEYPALFERCKL